MNFEQIPPPEKGVFHINKMGTIITSIQTLYEAMENEEQVECICENMRKSWESLLSREECEKK